MSFLISFNKRLYFDLNCLIKLFFVTCASLCSTLQSGIKVGEGARSVQEEEVGLSDLLWRQTDPQRQMSTILNTADVEKVWNSGCDSAYLRHSDH